MLPYQKPLSIAFLPARKREKKSKKDMKKNWKEQDKHVLENAH